jgi:hypothetical protein
MPHKFDPKQHIDAQGTLALARGEVEANEEMLWIAAFVWQNHSPGQFAAAEGTQGWPNGVASNWSCPTQTVPGSARFHKGKARAWALALVTKGSHREFYGWGHGVDLVK